MSDMGWYLLVASAFALATLWTCSTGPGLRFSPGLLFFIIFFLQQVLGFIVVADSSDPRDRVGQLSLVLGILGFSLGTLSALVFSAFRPHVEIPSIRERFQLNEAFLSHKVTVMIMGYILSIAILAYFFKSGGGIPLLQGLGAMLHGEEVLDAQLLLKEKRMALTYFEGSSYKGQGYVDQIRMQVLPYIVACFLIWATATKGLFWRILAVLAVIPVLLFLAGTGQRHPLLAFLVSMAILSYILSDPRSHRKVLLSFFGIGFLVFGALTYALGRYTHTGALGSDLSMVGVGIWHRIVFSNSINTLALFHIFPDSEPFRWGWTWLNDLVGFLPGPHVGFSSWLFRRLYGATGTASPMCFGEMYANFGVVGVFFGGMFIGWFLQTLQVFWIRMKHFRAEHLVAYSIVSMGLARWSMGGLLGPIQFGLVAAPLLYILIRVARDFMIILSRPAPFPPARRQY